MSSQLLLASEAGGGGISLFTGVLLPIFLILLLVVINGVFVAAEFALVGSQEGRLETMADDGNAAARWVYRVMQRATGKDSYVAVAQLGITLASIGLGMYGEPAVAHWLYGPFESFGLSEGAAHSVGFVVALGAITYLHVVFGEMIPKALALQTPEKVVVGINPVMRLFSALFKPMVTALNTSAFALMKLLRIPEPDKTLTLYSAVELEIVTDELAEIGEIGERQRELIHKIFDLDERRAEELMTSRGNVDAIDVNTPPEEVTARAMESDRSRYPIVDGNLDTVIGVLHMKDFIRARTEGAPLDLRRLARPLPSVAASATVEQLLERFKRDQSHAILVVDEFGGTIGFVTLDDIIAEVMEDDAEMEEFEAVYHPDGSVTVDGETTLNELHDDHGFLLEHDDVVTVAGLVLAERGTIPPVGATVRVQHHRLTVEAREGHKITRVRVKALPQPAPPTTDE